MLLPEDQGHSLYLPAPLRLKLSPFDRLVILTLLGLALLLALLIWRGDHVGVRIVALQPADGRTGVSSRTSIRVTFDRQMVSPAAALPLIISPAVSGTLRWEGTTLIFAPARPLASETTYTVKLAAGLQSDQGRLLLDPVTWKFHTGRPRILYIAPDTGGQDQLFLMTPPGGEPSRLTEAPEGIADYTLSPDGTAVAYSALRPDGGSDLWLVSLDNGEQRPLQLCPNATCSSVTWFPGGGRLIYERRNSVTPGAAPGPPRLWWLNLERNETLTVFDDSQRIAYGARFSPDGTWLTYVSPGDQGLQLYRLDGSQSFIIPSQMGGLAAWHPEGESLLLTDIRSRGEGFVVHLLAADVMTEALRDLSGEEEFVEDSVPAWSPDGQWIAFGRKPAGASMGRQIWLMRPDGSQVEYLTAEPDIHYGPPEWSPDSRYLLFQRYPLKDLGAVPSIWLFDLKKKSMQEIVASGNRPGWLP